MSRMTRMVGTPQRGFSLITAIFVLVILATLGTFIVGLAASQQMTTAYAALGSRAYYLARSGVEWGVARALGGSCPGVGAPSTLDAAQTDGYTVTVTCEVLNTVSESNCAATYNVFQITATAERGAYGSPDFVHRQVQANITQGCP